MCGTQAKRPPCASLSDGVFFRFLLNKVQVTALAVSSEVRPQHKTTARTRSEPQTHAMDF